MQLRRERSILASGHPAGRAGARGGRAHDASFDLVLKSQKDNVQRRTHTVAT